MADINLITAPDKLFNNATSFLLIYPSDSTKQQFNNLVGNTNGYFNVYLYEYLSDEHEIDWLFSTAKIADYVILDLDNSPTEIRELGSYLIANPNTYWLTSGEKIFYNKISNKKIYSLDYFIDKIGGNLDKSSE